MIVFVVFAFKSIGIKFSQLPDHRNELSIIDMDGLVGIQTVCEFRCTVAMSDN